MTYEIWLSQGKERLRLPVLPIDSGLSIDNPTSNESHKVSKLGEVTVLQDPDSKIFAFSSIFPLNYGPYCEYRKIPKPQNTVKLVEKWQSNGLPIRFILAGKVNKLVSIESFHYREQGGSVGDLYYDITLKEYRQISVRQVTHKPAPRPSPPAKPKTKAKPSVKTHTVKKGDTLWALAGKYYKNSTQWRKIWNVKANKDMMVKRDKRNLKQPGHWLHIGQKIIIP